MIRVLTFSVDGKRQTSGAALYNIPLNKFMSQIRVRCRRGAR